ncbi:MAG TPA: peptidyl-alpha-hydroxyglycine alpha-amidating lyase family protein [Roseomonas sp.]
MDQVNAMAEVFGSGAYRYAVTEPWAKLPDGIVLGEVGGVAVDERDQVYVFNRSPDPMLVFDRHGNFLRAWGQGVFPHPHGVHVGPDGTLWCSDDRDHTVRQCTPDGKVLLQIGTPGKPAPYMSGKPFCRCTHTAHAPNGDIFVSDGYGNPCVHKFSPDGRHLLSWGRSGTGEGEFNLPHNITCDADGWVYVADRESHRIQVFDSNGRYETQWNNLHRPSALFMPKGSCPICYVGECGPGLNVNRAAPNLGPRVSILDNKGKLLARIGGERWGLGGGAFISPHGIAVDSHGDIYVGEVAYTGWGNLNPDLPRPERLPYLRKLTRQH